MSGEWFAIVFLAMLCALPGCVWFGWWLAQQADRRVDRRAMRGRHRLIDALTDPKSGEWK